MIGIDTNVLVRGLFDEPGQDQALAVRRLLEACAARGEPVHVNLLVLAETVWVLRRRARLGRDQIVAFVQGLLQSREIVMAERAAVEAALGLFRAGRTEFPDALIGHLNAAAGCATTYTFDRVAAADLPGFTLLP